MIVKIQRSMSSSDGPSGPTVLIYDEHKTFLLETGITLQLLSLFKKGEIKVFYHAKIVNKKLKIGKRAKYQDW